jgi:hypothetical protein
MVAGVGALAEGARGVVVSRPVVVDDLSAFSATMRSGLCIYACCMPKSADMTRVLLTQRRLSCPSAREELDFPPQHQALGIT